MIGTALYFIQEKMMFRPTVLEQNYQFQFNTSFEEVNLNAQDGAMINAIHFKAKDPKGVILYFHGNAGDLSRWGKITERFVDYNYDVFIMDYRTYGKSTGKLSEKALYHDAELCYNYINQFYASKDVIVYGRSLGTGIAANIASKHDVKQLILETPYYSIADVAKHRFPIFPVKQLLKYKMPTYQFLESVDCPITIFHGTDDYVVPFSSGKKLKEISKQSINFIAIEGGNHNNLADFKLFNSEIEKILN
ncbi:alpha/beta fold hydrolase [Ichthyenterobacterium sp. W332]|uniref:Alpha/beta fold hydrolase n=1 Tax=Microcosmobacter mediterraneus TaxID=3075607 RepID=A0ABU2YMR1_9FLAO|nr:alpha/beta fold hydrolase [Ichthyenterobacterium sp. W332]MDT0559080.1 alpha/beta fold hydrolase [Ichthyenterobacterium sp. W332]